MPASAEAKEEQVTDQFTTLAQYARVVINRIDLLYTCERELGFELHVVSRPGTRGLEGKIGGPKVWNVGSHSLSGEVSIEHAPDQLSVLVFGTKASLLDYPGNENALLAQVMSANGRDYNVARREFNIGISPTERYVTIPFVIRSLDGNILMFEAHGQIQVTRK